MTGYALIVFSYVAIFLFFVVLDRDNGYTVIVATCHVPVLVIAGVMEGFVRLQHRRRQSLGYLNFYKQTRKLLPVPFQTAAYAVSLMLVVVALMPAKSNSERKRYEEGSGGREVGKAVEGDLMRITILVT